MILTFILLEYKRTGPYRNSAITSILSYLNKDEENVRIFLALNSIYNIFVWLIHLQKAFDTVDHDIYIYIYTR